MRWAVIALALIVAGCTSIPEAITISFPQWMRGQGIGGQQSASQPSQAATSSSGVSAPSGAALILPTGTFPEVHAGFADMIAARYDASPSLEQVRQDLLAQGFICNAQAALSTRCERVVPLAGQCSDVFTVTHASGATPYGDVRRRCPVGVTPPA